MKMISSSALGIVAAAALSATVFAQATNTNPTAGQAGSEARPQAPPAQQNQTAADQAITVVGCVQREADYRRAQDAGRGGVAGTGVGAQNEYILTNASTSTTGAAADAGKPARGAAGATGTAGTSVMAYELTGKNEGQVGQFVGKRVEISGRVKMGDPAGGPTADAPPRGVDVASRDLKLREIEVTSVKEATGSCP